jgi:hypothetical protein
MFLIRRTTIKRSDCKNVIIVITPANHKNFHKINSYLLIGLLKIRKIVFHSISLKRSWLQTKSTQISQNISISASQKSKITFSHSQIVSFPRPIDNNKNKIANTKIKYKNLFLIISLKVLSAIFHIQKDR